MAFGKEYDSIEVPEGIYTIQTALSSSKTLDIANGSKANFGNIWIYNINNTEAQEFEIEKVSDGYYKIESKLSGKVLDVANGSRTAGAMYGSIRGTAPMLSFGDLWMREMVNIIYSQNWVLY